MAVAPGPSRSRGEITLQPNYFTSSLYVDPCRQDFQILIDKFSEKYPGNRDRPFTLFKSFWNELGWTWLHIKVFDARTRDMFINITLRIFLERLVETEQPLTRVVALFALYAFYTSQPSTSAPRLHTVARIPICSDVFASLLAFPNTLTSEELGPLRPHVSYILSLLLDQQTFYMLPSSHYYPLNPRDLPREIFVKDTDEYATARGETMKTGRPSKRDKLRQAKDAIAALDKWLDKNSYVPPPSGEPSNSSRPSTHILVSHPPTTSRNNYRFEKSYLLDSLGAFRPPDSSLEDTEGQKALKRANEAVLRRLKEIDELAAIQGLEVGGEGGEKTGLTRVERAVAELTNQGQGNRGGILGLLDGGGIEDAPGDGL